jgi:molybdopterin converting factor small subunit
VLLPEVLQPADTSPGAVGEVNNTGMPTVVLHYWAGARAAAGVDRERYDARSVADAVAQAGVLSGRTRLAEVLAACSFLVDGVAQHIHDLDTSVPGDIDVEVLPPFAGGA